MPVTVGLPENAGWRYTEVSKDVWRWHYNTLAGGVAARSALPPVPLLVTDGEGALEFSFAVQDQDQVLPMKPEEVARVAAGALGELHGCIGHRQDLFIGLLGVYLAVPLPLRQRPALVIHGWEGNSWPQAPEERPPLGSNLTRAVTIMAERYAAILDGLSTSPWGTVMEFVPEVYPDISKGSSHCIIASLDFIPRTESFGLSQIEAAFFPTIDPGNGEECCEPLRAQMLDYEVRTFQVPLQEQTCEGRPVEQLPRQLYAGYVRWLAAKLDEVGPQQLSARIESYRRDFAVALGLSEVLTAGSGEDNSRRARFQRTSREEGICSAYAALAMFGDFLAENMCRDLLPTQPEIVAGLRSLLST